MKLIRRKSLQADRPVFQRRLPRTLKLLHRKIGERGSALSLVSRAVMSPIRLPVRGQAQPSDRDVRLIVPRHSCSGLKSLSLSNVVGGGGDWSGRISVPAQDRHGYTRMFLDTSSRGFTTTVRTFNAATQAPPRSKQLLFWPI